MQVTQHYSRRIPKLLPLLVICLFVAVGTSNAQSDAQKAFEKLKTLKGSWQGSFAGLATQLTIRVTSAGSAIMHDALMAKTNKISMIYVEGDRLFLIHYGGEGNRPRMEGKLLPDGNRIEFSLLDVGGGTQKGFVKRMVFTIVDANNHTLEGTYIMPDGKPVEVRGEFLQTTAKENSN